MADGDILSDSTATWTAYDQLAQTFVNAVTRSKTDAGTYVIAQWADEITNALADINSAANGEHVWTDAGVTARFGGAPATGWNINADNIVEGDGASAAEGMSFWPSDAGTFSLAVRNSSTNLRGMMRFDQGAQLWSWWTNGVQRWGGNNAAVYPIASMSSGLDGNRWSAIYSAGTIYAADAPTTGWAGGYDELVIGDGTASHGISIYSSATGLSGIAMRDPAVAQDGYWRFSHNDLDHRWGISAGNVMRLSTASLNPESAGGLTLGTSSLPWGNLLVFTSLKTANYTATAGQRVPYDASGGTFTLTAPASPSQGERWAVKETADDATAITIAGNGSNIEDPVGGTVGASFSLGLAYVSVEWEYDGTAWRVI